MKNGTVANIAALKEIPDDLRTALSDLFQAYDSLKSNLLIQFQARYDAWCEQLLKEASDATVDTHWWESMLFLMTRNFEPLGNPAGPFLAASQNLAPLLMKHLGPYSEVSLREINQDTVIPVCRLSDTLSEPQIFHVAPNSISLAQALFNKKAWHRAIYAGKALVGFIMLYDDEQEHDYFLWRFMISKPCQGRGYGAQAIHQLVEYVKTRPNARELGVSCIEGEDGPQGFYEKLGFVSTGEYDDGELVLKRKIEIE